VYCKFRLFWSGVLSIALMIPVGLGSSLVHAEEGEIDGKAAEAFAFSQIALAQKTKAAPHLSPTQPSYLASSMMMADIFHKLDVQMPREVEKQYELGMPIARIATAWLPGDLLYYRESRQNQRQQVWVAMVVNPEHIAYAGPGQSIVYRSIKEVNRHYALLGVRRVLSPADRMRFSLVLRAGNYIGAPYMLGARYGQTDTFDCSSFIKTIYAKEGIALPRVSRQQARVGERIPLEELRVGDLLFFTGKQSKRQIAHVAMYAGSGMMIHTYGKGGVRYTAVGHPIWKQRFVMARRVVK